MKVVVACSEAAGAPGRISEKAVGVEACPGEVEGMAEEAIVVGDRIWHQNYTRAMRYRASI